MTRVCYNRLLKYFPESFVWIGYGPSELLFPSPRTTHRFDTNFLFSKRHFFGMLNENNFACKVLIVVVVEEFNLRYFHSLKSITLIYLDVRLYNTSA